MSDKRNDPFRGYNFSVEIDNIPRGAFSEVSGLTAESDAADYREGTDVQRNVRKLVGLVKYSDLMFKRGYTQDGSLWAWWTNIMNGQPDRRNVTIVLMDEARKPVMRWHAENAWIKKIEGPALKAAGNEIAMESMELVHEGLTIELQ
jgi:phage tail-like protein